MHGTPESSGYIPPEAEAKAKTDFDPSVFRDGNPWRVVADLNEACNIQCDYCHIDALWGKNARNSRTLDPSLVGTLLSDADQMKVFDVTLTGGEITILPNLDEYLESIKGLDFTSVQMITNGTRLTPGLAQELKEVGLQRVSISIDGPEGSNDSARGDGVWKKAWKGLENALDAGLDVNVISVLGQHNIDDWQELPPILKEMGVRSQNVSLMCRLGRAEEADEWKGVPEERVDEVRRKARALQEQLNDDAFFMSLNDGVMKEPGWTGEPTPIHAFQDQNPGIEAVVKVNGDVLRNRLYGKDRAVGNLYTESLPEIWNRDKAQRAQMSGVVGEENVNALPELYYYYDGQNGEKKGEVVQAENAGGTGSGDLRVREESWGTVIFDRRTFSITDIQLKEQARE